MRPMALHSPQRSASARPRRAAARRASPASTAAMRAPDRLNPRRRAARAPRPSSQTATGGTSTTASARPNGPSSIGAGGGRRRTAISAGAASPAGAGAGVVRVAPQPAEIPLRVHQHADAEQPVVGGEPGPILRLLGQLDQPREAGLVALPRSATSAPASMAASALPGGSSDRHLRERVEVDWRRRLAAVRRVRRHPVRSSAG